MPQIQPADYRPDGSGGQVPVYQNATPGFSGAILDLLRALGGGLTRHREAPPMGGINPANRASLSEAGVTNPSQAPQTSDLGNQF